jgi:retron-type reverse transcriptase
LALLCTEPQVDAVELDGETYYVASSERQLPQGAPTSPALSNIICRRLDRRLLNIANSLGFIYTRYADDLSFSAADANSLNIGRLLRRTSVVVAYEGFVIHPDKTHIMHKGRRQEVTGLIVNQKLSIDRRTMRRFRATLFQIEKDGPDGKRWGHSDNLFASILGFSSYVAMVDPDKGKDLLTRTKQLATQYGYSATICPAPSPIPDSDPNDVDSPAQSEATETKEDWWKLW